MKRFSFCLLVILILSACASSGGTRVSKEPDLHTKWPFMVGAAVARRALLAEEERDLLRHFNVLVAENEMKPDALMTNTPGGAYNWTNADLLMNFAEENGYAVRGHTLVWHSQTPAWFYRGSGRDGLATKDELYTRMERHIKTVFEKYGGRIGWWDVVNEVVGNGGPRTGGTNPRDGQSPYTKIMEDSGLTGMDRYEYVLKAFQWARQYADANGGENVKLYINDYNIEFAGAKQSELLRLVDWLIEKDAPIDGVGLQSHIAWDGPSTASISRAIDSFAEKTRKDGTNLMTQITELDISVFSSGGGEGSRLTLMSSELDLRLRIQTRFYRELFDMFEEKYNEGKLDMVLVWGVSDEYSWLNNRPRGRFDMPLLFNRDFEPKPAYWALIEDR